MRISDWSSDVCSSDLPLVVTLGVLRILLRVRLSPALDLGAALARIGCISRVFTFTLTLSPLLLRAHLPRPLTHVLPVFPVPFIPVLSVILRPVPPDLFAMLFAIGPDRKNVVWGKQVTVRLI